MKMRKLKNISRQSSRRRIPYYDKEAADFAVNFIQCLCHTKGTWAGKPFELIDWQEQIIRDLFGILKPNGYGSLNTAYIEIRRSRGNPNWLRQWPFCSVAEMVRNGRKCMAVPQTGSRRPIVFEVAADMVRMCPALK